MQPRTIKKRDIDNIKRSLKNTLNATHGLKQDIAYCTDLPEIIGFKLTNKCNLRCKTCYEWNKEGYHNFMSEKEKYQELDFQLFKKVIQETRTQKSSIYLWGGEPLCHSKFKDIIDFLIDQDRLVAICTNGTLLEEYMDSIVKLGKKIELLIAVDGPKDINDSIRGKGTFEKAINNIKKLVRMKKNNIFNGKISVHCVINEELVSQLYDLLVMFEEIGVENVILCYPWYLSSHTSIAMDKFYKNNIKDDCLERASWHSFKYKLSQEKVSVLLKEKKKIMEHIWKVNVRFQPNLSDNNIALFLEDNMEMENYLCYSVINRMDILADGTVSSCKHFPEMVVGDLYQQSVYEIWHSENFKRIREVVQTELMPVCRVCNNLYLHGRKK